MPLDYTQKMYIRLMEGIAHNYHCYSICDYIRARQSHTLPSRFFIVRHDVDGNVENALEMAKIDARNGIRATYYFRTKPRLFSPRIIRSIAELGHEIGYHYEVLSDARGNFAHARNLFEDSLLKLRRIAPVETACMHGRAMSKYHNLDFWKRYSLEEFDLLAEPYLDIDYTDMYYFTDTGLCWDNRRFNIRDIVQSKNHGPIQETPELLAFINTSANLKGAILTHTNVWTDRIVVLMFYKLAFWGINRIKYLKKKRLACDIRNSTQEDS